MIRFEWLSEALCDVLRWHVANPGRRGDDADAPELPWAGQRLWSTFMELNGTRTGTGFGPNPIAYAEIEAWCRQRHEPLRPFEIDILRAMDAALLDAVAKRPAATDEQGVATRPVTPGLFDAVFGAGS